MCVVYNDIICFGLLQGLIVWVCSGCVLGFGLGWLWILLGLLMGWCFGDVVVVFVFCDWFFCGYYMLLVVLLIGFVVARCFLSFFFLCFIT